jgi:hypothetical protein
MIARCRPILVVATTASQWLKTTLLLFHTTGFDSSKGHRQVYIHKVKTYKTRN